MTSKTSRSTGRRRLTREATIRDVAAKAGVSVATVSRVLNDPDLVREETSRQVLDAAKLLRYVPNTAARSLSARRSHTIGVLLPDVHGQFFSEVIRGVDAAAREAKYHILVSGWHSDAGEMIDMVNAMRGRVDGLLVMAPDLAVTALREQLSFNLPVVILNSFDDQHAAVTIDNFGGAQAMTAHLASLGHERIAFIKGPSHNNDARERLRGYRQVMRRVGGRQPAFELEGDFSEEAGRKAALHAADLVPRPTAIFAANDSMAVGVIAALQERGINVPGDIAVAGFDDIPIARYITPALTTVHVDIADLGQRAFGLLIEAIARRSAARRRESISTSLVVRDSCGARADKRQPTTNSRTAVKTKSR
jgi:LacI family transcriptional regulator